MLHSRRFACFSVVLEAMHEASQGFKTATRELLRRTEEKSISPTGVIDLPSKQVNDFVYQKETEIKNCVSGQARHGFTEFLILIPGDDASFAPERGRLDVQFRHVFPPPHPRGQDHAAGVDGSHLRSLHPQGPPHLLLKRRDTGKLQGIVSNVM